MESALQHHWQRLSLATLPPSRRGSSLVFDKKRRQTVFVAAGETWLWNGQTWGKMQSRNAPPARNTTHVVYDITTECVLLFGGIGVDGTPLNDTWLWDGATWTEQHPAQTPSAVGGAAMACHAASRQVILFGGIAGFDGANASNRVGTLSNETWLWDGATWTEQQASSVPPVRIGGQLIYDEARQQTVLFGGNGSSSYLNDMWRWNGAGWDQLHPTTLPPARARYHVTFHEQLQQIMLLGEIMGGGNQAQRSYQIWSWDGASWAQYAADEVLPGSIEGFAYDGARNSVLACVVTGGKAQPASKSAGASLPELAAPVLASETWAWG